MQPIIALFEALGLSRRVATVLAWVAAAFAALALYGAVRGILGVFDWFDDRAAVRNAVNEANADALETARAADDIAAGQAAVDDQVLDKHYKETIDAIEAANDDGPPSAAAVAHNCQRLRRAGFKGADLPEPCRRGKDPRAQADARP